MSAAEGLAEARRSSAVESALAERFVTSVEVSHV
jgi:hypothetical protein